MLRSPGPAYDLRAAMSQELRAAINELADAPSDPRALHRCRVHVKRARALARVGHTCAPGLSDVFNDTARGLMRLLGRVRDLNALSEAARTVAGKVEKKAARTLVKVAGELDAELAASPPLNVEAARAGLKDLLALALVWPEASPRQISRGARRLLRRARRARRRGAEFHDIAHRHEWRKRAKDRFYAASMLGAHWPAARMRKLGEKLGDALGRERDALLLIDRLKANPGLAGDHKTARQALKALHKRRKRLTRRADKIGARMQERGA
jgi:CHAD domain-containing protein